MASAGNKWTVSICSILPSVLNAVLLLFALSQAVQAQTVNFNQQELDWIGKHPQISVGVDDKWPPIDFIDSDGQRQGISNDIIQLIAAQTGINFIPTTANGWHDMLNKAAAREIDIVATLAKNSEREKTWDFSASYFRYPYVITTRKQENSLNDLKSLDGKTVAIEEGYFLHQELINNHPRINLLVVDNSTQALQAVSREQADAYVGNQAVIFFLIEQQRLTNLKVAADSGYPGGKLHFGVRKDWPELVTIINKVLANTPEAQIKQIERRWLGLHQNDLLSQNKSSNLKFTREEEIWLENNKQLSIGVMQNWPPISEVTPTGQLQGIDIDIVKQINQRLNDRIQLVAGPWDTIYQDIMNKKLDLIIGITPQVYRRSFMEFSTPYLSVPHVIVARHDINEFYADEQSLAGKVIALEEDFVNVSYFRQNYSDVIIKTYENTLAALEAVSRGDADAYAGSRVVVLYLIEKQLLSNLRIHGRLSKPATELAIGTRKDYPILASIIQKVIDDINPSAVRQIVNKWIPLNTPADIEYTLNLSIEEQQWLDQHPDLAVGIMDNWPPFNFVNAAGEPEGIGVDIIRELNLRLDNKISIVPGKWKQIYNQVENKKLDLILDITPKPTREPFFNFTKPYLDIPHVIIAQRKNIIYRSEDDLGNKILALEEGFGNVKYFQQKYPDVQIKLYPDTEQALEAVSCDEADAYAGNRVVALYLIEKLALSNLKVHGRLNKPGSILSIGTRKDYPMLRNILQKTLDSIGEQKIRAIKNRWIYESAKPGEDELILSDTEKQWLVQHRVIPIGVDGSWPPIDFYNEQQQHSGITADYLKLLGKKLGIVFIPQKSDSFKQMLQAVINGDQPVGASISFNKDRATRLLFTRPFFSVQKVIMTRKDATAIINVKDLYGKTVAIEDGFLTMSQLQEKHPDIHLVPVKSTRKALEKVSWGDADAYIGNQAVASWLVREHQLNNLRIVGDAGLKRGPQNFAVSKLTPEWKPLIGILDKALSSITLEQQIEIENRWLGQGLIETTTIPVLKLSNEQKNWLQKHPVFRPGVDAKWKPLEYIDEQGIYQGLSSDFIKYFTQQLGVTLEAPAEIPWSEVLQGLRKKNIDLSPLLIKTAERSEYLNFTKPYINFPVVIFNQRGTTLLGGLSDLSDKNVGMVDGYAIAEFIQQDHPEIQQIKFKDTLEGLQALATGKIDAYIDVLSVGAYLIASHGMSNLQVAASTPYQHDFSIGVRKDWPELIPILNQAIDQLPPATKNQFLKKWLVVKYQKEIDYTLLSWVVAVAVFIFIILSLRAREMARINGQITEGRERLALSLESAELGTFEFIFHKNADTRFNYDETFATHHSLPEQYEFKDVAEFFVHISPDQNQMVREKLRSYVKGEIEQFKVEYQVSKNQHWLSVQGRIFERDSKGWAHRLIGISQDINERKQAQIAMEKSSRFKSQFLANMSHEIRTPMNAIVGLGHLLLRSGLNKKQSEYLTNLQKSAKILLGLIDDILDFSKIEAGHLRIEYIKFNLEELLIDLSEMTALRMTQENVEFIIDIDPKVPKILVGDSFRLNQVLTNLVSNAIKFTEAGNIILKVSLDNHTHHEVSLLFSVSDTGIGIGKNNLASLFDPFIQEDGSTTRKYGGTGLGLSISKQLTQLMGGQLKAESKKGKGSRFFFSLPFKLAAHHGNKRLLSPPTTDLRGMRVLIADDNPTSLQILTDTLGSLNFKVSSVNSGDQAIQTLMQAPQKFDLLLVDWRMPDKDGIATASEIKQTLNTDKMPLIILMTAYGKDLIEIDSDKFLLDGLLIKPITPSSLFNAIIQAKSSTADDKVSVKSDAASQNEIHALTGNVILAEDNPINQQVAVEILRQMGLTVSVCNNGTEVLELMEKSTPDLILMDIQMPKMDGYETVRNIRAKKQYDQLPILAMTANAMKEDIQKSIDAGMQGHISKPVDPDILYQTLCEYLDFASEDDLITQNSGAEPFLQARSWPESIPGLNIKRGIKQIGGNEKLYQKLLKDFLHNHGHLRKDLNIFIQQSDLEQAARAIHTIKGVSGNIGAERLYQVCSEIDNKLKQSTSVENELLEEFSLAYDELSNGINLLQSNNTTTQDDIQSVDTSIHDLLQSLHNCDANSQVLLDQLNAELEQTIGTQNLQKIYTLVKDYEFQLAAEELEKTIKGQNDEH